MAQDTYCVFILKVHTGLHCTAEFLLENQEYTLGSDHNSDIILQDSCICPHHVKLQLLDHKVYLQPLKEAQVSLNGLPITQVTDINPSDILEFGDVIVSLYKFELLSNPSESLKRQFLTVADSKKALDQLKFLKESIKVQAEIQDKSVNLVQQEGSYYIPIFTIGIIMLSCVLNIIDWDFLSKQSHLADTPQHAVDSLDFELEINNYFKKAFPKALISIDHANKTITVQGYVQNQKEKHALLKPIPYVNYQKIIKVDIIDSILETMQNIAYIVGVSNINVSYDNERGFTLKGLVNSAQDIEMISHLVHLDIQGIKDLNIQLIPVKQLNDYIQGVSISADSKKSYVKTIDNKKKYVGSYLLPNVMISKIEDYILKLQYYDKIIKYDFVHNKFLEIE